MKIKPGKYLLFIFLNCLISFSAISQNARNGNPEVLHLPPEVDFGWTNACYGDTVKFYNASYRANTYTWTISTATGTVVTVLYTDTGTNISYYFPAKGTYSVELDGDNGHIISVIKTVIVDTSVTADFSFMHCMNIFSNMSFCATSCLWDFGDGFTSTAQIPVHQYADTGSYTVKLIAYNGGNSDTVSKQIYLSATHFASAAFTWYQSNDTLFFHALDVDPGMEYFWSWGDFTSSTGQDTFHVYPDSGGTYIIDILVRNGCGNTFGKDTIYVMPTGVNYFSLNYPYLKVFPNPAFANSEIRIAYRSFAAGSGFLCIYNSLGEKIMEENYNLSAGDNELKLKTSGFSPGLYYFYLKNAKINAATKFLILAK